MIRRCCVCHRIERHGTWEVSSLLAGNEPVTHGYCPDCFTEAMAEIKLLAGSLVPRGQSVPGWPMMRGQWG